MEKDKNILQNNRDNKNQKKEIDFSDIYRKIEEKNKKDKEKIEKEKIEQQEKEQEELDEESDFVQSQVSSPSFNGSFASQSRAPVLESVAVQTAGNLEGEINQVQTTNSSNQRTEDITETRDKVYLVQNAPKYSATDYNFRNYDSNNDLDDSPRRIDMQTDITQGRLMHRAPVLQENNEIRLGAWQRENVFNQNMGGSGWNPSGALSERDYQIARSKNQKSDNRLPFE